MGHFTTISKSINNKNHGTFEYLKYLTSDEEHPEDDIITFKEFNHRDFMKNSIQKEKNLIKLRKKQKKANKAKNYSQSFMFSLPHIDENIPKSKWELIIKDMIPELKDMLKTTEIDDIFKNVYINVHHRKGSNSHLNIVFNKIHDEGIHDLSKKRFIYKLRTSFSKSAAQHLSINPPMTEFEKKRDLQNQENQRIKEENQNLKNIINGQNKVVKSALKQSELIKWTQIFLQNANKYSRKLENAKMLQNIQKAKNNILELDDEEIIKSFNEEIQQIEEQSLEY